MQFTPTAEEMLSLASEYNERLDALREEGIEAQEADEQWLERWTRDERDLL
jgi:hypothetical protein